MNRIITLQQGLNEAQVELSNITFTFLGTIILQVRIRYSFHYLFTLILTNNCLINTYNLSLTNKSYIFMR
jgi:hypothetical protein